MTGGAEMPVLAAGPGNIWSLREMKYLEVSFEQPVLRMRV